MVTPLGTSDVALQADGRILLVGSVRVRDIDFEVVRYNADGSLDSTFGNAGVVVTNIRGDEAANAVVAEPGGKIIVAGQGFGPTSLRPDFMLVRYQPDGTLDFSFGSGGVVYTDFGGRRDSVVDLLIQPDGKIVAGGLGGANRLNVPDDFVLARYLPSGSLDASFNNGGMVRTTIHEWSSMTALDLQVDGKIVAVGRSFNLAFPMTVDDAVVVQYRADGTVDRNFGVDGVVYMRSPDGVLTVPSDVDVQPDGQILVTWGRSLARYRYDSVRGAFGGTPHPLPGRIEAEHYDLGGQSTGYFDTTPGNEQDVFVFRTDDVDIKVSREGGHTIGWLAGGEWLAYTSNLARPGIYVVEARVGSVFPGRTFHVEVDGRDVTGPIAVPQVPEWDTYETVRVGGIELAAGIQVLRVVMGSEDFMDFKWLAVIDGRTWAYGGVPHPIPGAIEAEEYDLGGQGVGYFDTTPGNEQGHAVFRGDDVDIKESREGGYTIRWLAAGEWLAYTADVQRSGLYAIEARVGSVFPGRTFHVEVDGREATGPIAVPQVAEWDTYQTVRVEGIELGAGIQVLRVVMGPQDFMDFQWLQLVRIAGPD
ncbi:MAG: hypothetical protein JWN34_3126 [Bryobacterales bacterium]|nr:hypothetical protein [Bryobacterales bacterium]